MLLIRIYLFVIGCCLGSFINVVIHRMPLSQSIVYPNSRCPKCYAKIKWFDNLPVISWFLLRGKCRACNLAIRIGERTRDCLEDLSDFFLQLPHDGAMRREPSQPQQCLPAHLRMAIATQPPPPGWMQTHALFSTTPSPAIAGGNLWTPPAISRAST